MYFFAVSGLYLFFVLVLFGKQESLGHADVDEVPRQQLLFPHNAVGVEGGVDAVVGEDSLNHFGEFEEDSVYVRNENIECDYEILKLEKSINITKEALERAYKKMKEEITQFLN